jgi:S-DNA-T family DNA segregation ATPase FtsK/SpoIIIE
LARRVVDDAFTRGRGEVQLSTPEVPAVAPVEELEVPADVFTEEPDPAFVNRARTVALTEFPDEGAPEVDPDSTLDAPRFLDEKAAAGKPGNDGPRIEILDAPPPPSVVDDGAVALAHAAVHGNSYDDELTPIEALEAQAAASASEEDEEELRLPEPEFVDNRPRRRFGDGPYMPVYFDESVRALDPPVPPDLAGVEEDIQKGVQAVQETLGAFKIDARVTDVKRGPVITRYEVQPAPGVRVASIANLDRDLARSLSALAVRIEAPVPGKNVVGIEVPNKRVHLVRMRDVLEQPDFLSHQSKLAFVLGKDIAGQPKWADLTKMPHMLIAGSTNSGKSVCLNSIIASILVRAAPDEVRFSLIDPKRVELTLYRGIPHLMHDVVVEPKQAVTALRRAIEEMDRRYKLFATRGVRNIASYNAKLQPGERPMPYIVIVIDELADLMMTAAAEFEKLICRLAQLARATGIHLIVATQRPSVNVITGVIKANIPARVAFAVASQVDSRTILDSVGAERLIGSGDMLFDANNGGKSTRIQGAFLSEEEVNRVVNVVKDAYLYADSLPTNLPTFDLWTDDSDDDVSDSKPSSDEKRDDLYDSIKEFVLRHQEMSASMIQRKFEIGYPRAGRIVDQLERDGVVGPADGPKPRKVLGAGNRE